MAFVATREQVGFKATGVTCTVPNDPIAKLMYYLRCVNTCVDALKGDVTDYNRYRYLSQAEKAAVVALAAVLSPDELLGTCFFLVEAGSPILNGTSNEFYEIERATDILGGAVGNGGVVIVEGRQVRVQKIMVHNRRWLDNNFLNPFKSEAYRLQAILDPPKPQPQIRYNPPPSRPAPVSRPVARTPAQSTPRITEYDGRELTPSSPQW
eukprot:CAMPEP_0117060274 /NCGR_PEP_ID=MMETSP0472-20121206/41890_1 /TAXON_ID=693140 ORGANISM="Tiarina fusus, Strain LIS" /NCGR_SAMPLE_ID=MMETSP0472 /ASSEMBLY_ACC=CAM_ASM_000603 /LENGTH=208 /DNA_ID=CAMNT_0004778351 /DNA_START=28 /DNA_END=651 /DNA_ORIENTATION=+